ncbi:hypothetical protein P153DRAFT_352741 [Dothidotthia symphoricarpi CBS 119687]|uniref:Uncharacterized protein n=1 Tax=Dothidotthia symphoricarpi CBS 119687 TaxID=1392245 RepID=A0A6A6AW89_9PLEO|nr:uncharacterized protein P153DRAFT_352741 [Dothidotthia symphoricarpi CBS 119687]KAF2134801.1 hypothetical protein P153DRAFT_352741 [Dothidotthia symphoricarpi CBS 119687]
MPSSSSFLALPRELRNSIYEYALTSTTGLYYREPSELDHEYKNTKPKSYQKPRIRKPILYIRHYETHDIRASDEFNQLAYVNRQIRAETTTQELKYNKIHFRRHRDDQRLASLQLISFLKCRSVTTAPWPIEIAITDFDTEQVPIELLALQVTMQHGTELNRLCSERPNVSVQFTLSGWRGAKDNTKACMSFFVVLGICLMDALRGKQASPCLLRPGSRCQTRVNKILKSITKDRLQGDGDGMLTRAANLRVVPDEGTVWDEEKWLAFMDGEGGADYFHREETLEQVKRWIEEGI